MASVQYPIFLDIAGCVDDDEYWRLIYEDMAYGRFPSGVYIQNNHFCCRHKDREYNVPLEGDVFVLFTQVHSFLKNYMGILSEHDREAYKSQALLTTTAKARDETKKVIKDSTLMVFVIREGKRCNVPETVMRRIFSLLIIGFMFKTLLVKDVVFHDNDIQKIHGFQFSGEKVRIHKNVLQLKKSHIIDSTHLNKSDAPPVVLSSYWAKYRASISSMTT